MSYGNNILISVDLILNTDLGLLYLIKEKFNNPEYMDIEMLDIPEKVLINELLERPNENPLSIIIKEKYENQMESLRQQFLDSEYEEILELSKPTNILDLLLTFLKTDLIHVTILCKNVLEEQIIKKYTESMFNMTTIIEQDLKNIKLDTYDSIYLKNYKDILKFDNVEGKSIYIGKYNFNLHPNNINEVIPLLEVSAIIGNMNRVFVIDVYTINKSYIALG